MVTQIDPAVDELNELSDLLVAAQARTKISRARVSRSTLYDSRYHMAMIACAMRLHGDSDAHRILIQWLKLLQFLAARPTLVDPFLEYAKDRRPGGSRRWAQIPGGYVGDETHDGVIDLLVASGVLQKAGDSLEASTRYGLLASLADRVQAEALFVGECRILERLQAVHVSKALLGAS